MAGKRHRHRDLRDFLAGAQPTPESLAWRAQRLAQLRATLAAVREELGPELRRWLSAFELTLRWGANDQINIDQAATNMGSDRATATAALEKIRAAIMRRTHQ